MPPVGRERGRDYAARVARQRGEPHPVAHTPDRRRAVVAGGDETTTAPVEACVVDGLDVVECVEQLLGAHVPESSRPVAAGRDGSPAVRTEAGGIHGRSMWKNCDQRSVRRAPDTSGAVRTARDDKRTVLAERRTRHGTAVLEFQCAAVTTPQPRRTVRAGAEHELAVRAVADCGDREDVAAEVSRRAGRPCSCHVDIGVPDPGKAVLAGGDHASPIGTERRIRHRPPLPEQRGLQKAVRAPGDEDLSIPARRQDRAPIRAERHGLDPAAMAADDSHQIPR